MNITPRYIFFCTKQKPIIEWQLGRPFCDLKSIKSLNARIICIISILYGEPSARTSAIDIVLKLNTLLLQICFTDMGIVIYIFVIILQYYQDHLMNQECREFHSRLKKFLNVMQYASNVYLIHRSFSATSVTALCHCGNIVNPPAHKLVLPTILWNWYAWLSMPRRCTIRHRPLCWEHANSGKKFLDQQYTNCLQ